MWRIRPPPRRKCVRKYSGKPTDSPGEAKSVDRRQLEALVGEIAGRRQFRSREDWYQLKSSDVTLSEQGKKTFQTVGGSVPAFLRAALPPATPEEEWKEWKFADSRVSVGYWNNVAHRKQFLVDLARHHRWAVASDSTGLTGLDEFYQLTKKQVQDLGGSFPRLFRGGLLARYGNSPFALLQDSFVEHTWLPWKFQVVPTHWWREERNQKTFLAWLRSEARLPSYEDCYRLKNEYFLNNHGGWLLELHGSSVPQMLRSLYPDHQWLPWKFAKVPNRFWESRDNRMQYISWLNAQLGPKSAVLDVDRFYALTTDLVAQHDGLGFLGYYHQSVYAMLVDLFPGHDWMPWRFRQAPEGWWKSDALRHKFVSWLRRENGLLSSMEDCYKLSMTNVIASGGSRLATLFSSLPALLRSVFPSHEWLPWKFTNSPPTRAWWSALPNQRQYLEWLRGEISLHRSLDDLYLLTTHDLLQHHGGTLLSVFGKSIPLLVATAYPEAKWSSERFLEQAQLTSQQQNLTLRHLKAALPSASKNDAVVEKRVALARYFKTETQLEVDILVKGFNLAVEHQGERHFFDVTLLGESSHWANHDAEKALVCSMLGLHLIEVPFWASMKSNQAARDGLETTLGPYLDGVNDIE